MNSDFYVVDCKWEDWSEWTECSKSCGIGKQLSSRKIEQPSSHGGTECEGNTTKSKDCHEGPCPGAYRK